MPVDAGAAYAYSKLLQCTHKVNTMQAIRTRYIGPSNTRGSRVQAKCEARTMYVSYDHALNLDNNHRAACEALTTAMGWTPEHGAYYENRVGGVFNHDYYWVALNDTQTGAE